MWFDEDMPDRLYQWLLKQTPERHIEILGEALDLMQQYNGRSRKWCVMTAAGFTERENVDTGKTSWVFPVEEKKPIINDNTGHSRFELGKKYTTLEGKVVKFVAIHNEGTSYETMVDEEGVNRYTRRDYGRVTGTPHDYSCKRNTPYYR